MPPLVPPCLCPPLEGGCRETPSSCRATFGELWVKLPPTKDCPTAPACCAVGSLKGSELVGAAQIPLRKAAISADPSSPLVLSMSGIQKHVFLEPLVTLTVLFF